MVEPKDTRFEPDQTWRQGNGPYFWHETVLSDATKRHLLFLIEANNAETSFGITEIDIYPEHQ